MTALPAFELIRARSLAEVQAAKESHPGSRLLAGGTDLLANLRHGLGEPDLLIDITGLPHIGEITDEGEGLRIGAGVSLAGLALDPLIARHFPALAKAAAMIAGPGHRSSATLGGNLCQETRCIFYNESQWWRAAKGFCLKYRGTICHVAPTGKRCYAAYSGDLAPVLLVLGAKAELAGEKGVRSVELSDLFRDDGASHVALAEDEILLSLWVPFTSGLFCGYEKARLRGAIDFPAAGVALALSRKGENLERLAIAVTGTQSRPFLLSGLDAFCGQTLDEEALQKIGKLVQKEVSPMRTTLAPAHYRRRVAAALACRLAVSLFAAAEPARLF